MNLLFCVTLGLVSAAGTGCVAARSEEHLTAHPTPHGTRRFRVRPARQRYNKTQIKQEKPHATLLCPGSEPPVHTLGEEESKTLHPRPAARVRHAHLTDGRGTPYRRDHRSRPAALTVRIVATQSEFERMPYALMMRGPDEEPGPLRVVSEKATEVGVTEIVLDRDGAQRVSGVSKRARRRSRRDETAAEAPTGRSASCTSPRCGRSARSFEGRRLIAHCAPARTQRGKSVPADRCKAWRGRPDSWIGPGGTLFRPRRSTSPRWRMIRRRSRQALTLAHRRRRQSWLR